MQNDPPVERLTAWQADPCEFIYDMWGLVPQPLLPEYKHMADQEAYERDPVTGELTCKFRPEYFETFEKGKHITWQQWLLMRSVKWAMQGRAPMRIAVESGHGTGKSSSLAMLILWYLICFIDAQIPCTAPTQYQMHDVLWKEVKVWQDKMPDNWADLIDWSSGYIRVKESPEKWFARARTARKENPEALAGIHGDHVFFIIDEGSGVPDEVINTAEGSLTGGNVLVVVMSNHTRLIGWFHDAFNVDHEAWQNLSFDSQDSPIVDISFVDRIRKRHGEGTDEWRIRVKGKAPNADSVDDAGYVPLFRDSDINIVPDDTKLSGTVRQGIDPSGEGKDKTVHAVGDNFSVKIAARADTSNGKSIAKKAVEVIDYYGIKEGETDVDSFGIGSDTMYELGLANKRVHGHNVGEPSLDEDFLNVRAEAYWSLMKWARAGGEFVDGGKWKEQAQSIRYRRTLGGKIQIMPKDKMKKLGYPSPDDLDAVMLMFVRQREESDDDDDVVEGEAPRNPHIGI